MEVKDSENCKDGENDENCKYSKDNEKCKDGENCENKH
jgi:hypothetical protein